MVDSFVTLSRNHPLFQKYLDGHQIDQNGQSLRPIPIRSLNVATPQEEITFRMLRLESLANLNYWRSWWKVLRPETAIFVTGPLFLVTLMSLVEGNLFSPLLALVTALGILSFHFSLLLFNDYTDHVRGRDRIRPIGGTRAIQDGLIPAYQVKTVAIGLMILAAAAAAVVFLGRDDLGKFGVSIAIGLALIFAIEFFLPFTWFRGRGGTEIVSFFLAGPLLTGSYSWIVVQELSLEKLALGCVFGSMVGLHIYLNRFAQVMHDQQAGYKTWPARLGFDNAKRLGQVLVFVSIAWLVVEIFIVERSWYLWPGLITLLGFSLPLAARIGQVQSPLSSEISTLADEALKLHWVTTGVLATGFAALLAAG